MNLTLNKIIFFKIALFVIFGVWSFGFIFPALFPDAGLFQFFIKKFYSNICHQKLDKSFELAGNQFLVCARCTGIYLGIFIASGFIIFQKIIIRKPYFFFITLLLLALDVLFHNIGIYEYSKNLAFSTGLFFGSILFLYIQDQFFQKKG